MAITFACGGCGKRYDVAEAMAGRRARCKECGSEFRVPDSVASASAKADPRGDVFGLDEPMPGALPPRAGSFAEEPSIPRRIKAKKSKAKSSDGGGARAIVVLAILGLVLAGGAGLLVLVAGNLGGPESEYEKTIKEEIASGKEFLAITEQIHDVPSAHAFSGQFAAMMPRFEAIKQKYASLTKPTGWENSRLGMKYNGEMNSLTTKLNAELRRLQSLPGVAEVLRGTLPGAVQTPTIPPPNRNFPPSPPGPPPGVRPPNLGPPNMPRPPGPRFGPGGRRQPR